MSDEEERGGPIHLLDGRGCRIASMPTERAIHLLRLSNDAHRHLKVILRAYAEGDPKSALKYVRQLFRTLRKARRAGRPKLPDGATMVEQVTRYLEDNGLDATVKEFGLPHDTVLRYQREANKRQARRIIRL